MEDTVSPIQGQRLRGTPTSGDPWCDRPPSSCWSCRLWRTIGPPHFPAVEHSHPLSLLLPCRIPMADAYPCDHAGAVRGSSRSRTASAAYCKASRMSSGWRSGVGRDDVVCRHASIERVQTPKRHDVVLHLIRDQIAWRRVAPEPCVEWSLDVSMTTCWLPCAPFLYRRSKEQSAPCFCCQ